MQRTARHWAMEQIAVQNGDFFRDLTAAIGVFRKRVLAKAATPAADAKLPDLILDATGLNVLIRINPHERSPGMSISVPSMDSNHVFHEEIYKPYMRATDTMMLKKLGENLAGFVDRKNCRVGGVFSKVRSPLIVNLVMLEGDRFTDAEVAAVMLHELGHLFTYYDALGNYVVTALISGVAAKEVMGIPEPDKRAKRLKVIAGALNIHINDIERVINPPGELTADRIQMVIITQAIIEARNENGQRTYGHRAKEQLADQFAARHGAGAALVTGYHKLEVNHKAHVRSPANVTLRLFGLVTAVLATTILLFTPLLFIWSENPLDEMYDDPEARIRFIKQDLVGQLKQLTITDEQRIALLNDIALVESVEKQYEDHRDIYTLIWTTLFKHGRREWRELQLQKQIEQLTNNDLFIQASKFKAGVSV